ncbi:PAS domain-containing sensor histidine kinase [uncultured Oxalicibacterium sp.]|uniref:hybrid sensor histidine kinase/response regulator n=1 Tax=uncultured Oxalicibacterium sp. TaxID=1168540 RepID=UPI0025CEE466|nr:PAS domain-containing sensor histidine kinase [uncultured Oxalicibacterium sp.]
MHNSSPVPLVDSDRFRLLVASITDYAIFMLTPDGTVDSWNAGAQRFKGYREEEILGRHFSTFYTEEDRAAGIPARSLRMAEEEGRFEAEGWRMRKDGTCFWANVIIDPIKDENGRLLGFAKITRDITERKMTQEALQKSEQQFRLLVQGVTDYAIYMLDTNGMITSWNAGAQHIKGYTVSEIIGNHFSRFYTVEDQALGIPQRTLKIASAEGRYEQEGWRVRKDGSRFLANVVVDAIRDELGQLIGFAKVTRDITEKRAAAEQLEKANTALHQAQKMEALGQLTGGVAHDFNNLLAILSGGVDMLSLQLRGQQETRMLDSMRRAIERGAGLTQHLLSFARQQPLKPEQCNVNTVLSNFETVLQRAGNAGIQLELALAPGKHVARIDPGQFQTSLLNLVVNACDAMPHGGHIVIKTAARQLQAHEIGSLAAGSYIVISIRDNGSGMKEEVRQRALEPFFTTKDVHKGTGLGLSQVYGFMTQSGGDLTIESKPGQGTLISLYLPVVEEDAAIANDVEETKDEYTEHVLLVEDEIDLLTLGAELFRAIGYEVHTASSAEEAVAQLALHDNIDILFSDVMMPNGLNGIELANLVRERYPHIKIVLASGYAMPALQNNLQDLDGFTCINKPYQLSDLARVLRRAI